MQAGLKYIQCNMRDDKQDVNRKLLELRSILYKPVSDKNVTCSSLCATTIIIVFP